MTIATVIRIIDRVSQRELGNALCNNAPLKHHIV